MLLTKNLRVIAALGTLSGAVWAGTFASFTDDAGAGTTFQAGTVDLVVGGDAGDAHAFAALSVPNMKPGDVQYAPLDVANAGTLGFTYGMTATATDVVNTPAGLGAALQVAVRSVAAGGDCTATGWANGTDVVTAGPVTAASFAGRSVADAAAEVLCFRVGFPEGGAADNALQGAATTVSFSFTAQQA